MDRSVGVELTTPLSPRPVYDGELLARMNFLNEAALRYPQALSLASGRPELLAAPIYAGWLREAGELLASDERYLQYGATAGIVCDLLAGWIAERFGIALGGGDVVVTTGAQEAMTLALLTLFEPGRDVLLVPDPTYLGILGAAAMLDVDVVPLARAAQLDGAGIDAAVRAVAASGKRARGVYVIPDYDNPTGDSIPPAQRNELVEAAARHDLVLLEDVAYAEFGFDGAPRASLGALDPDRVVQLGTFAKIAFPGLRLGYLASRAFGRAPRLRSACEAAKSFVTLNTAAPSQAVLAVLLTAHRAELLAALAERRETYRAKRDVALAALDAGGLAARGASWNRPAGGFFLNVRLPFAFGEAELERCARDFGVVVSPMRYFSLGDRVDAEVRIAYSNVAPAGLATALGRFADFVAAVTG